MWSTFCFFHTSKNKKFYQFFLLQVLFNFFSNAHIPDSSCLVCHSMLIQGKGNSLKVRFKFFILFVNSHNRNSYRLKRKTSRFKFSYSYRTEHYWSIVNTAFYSKLNIRQWRNIQSNLSIK
ncbi:hypothetical protein V8G54_023035 [Vigna mungo]|uniref:Uncharacterized protein n=1 Tax=Vigna mungo TaxID=3915 RepID=A0AAQ3RNS3_VIGMU